MDGTARGPESFEVWTFFQESHMDIPAPINEFPGKVDQLAFRTSPRHIGDTI